MRPPKVVFCALGMLVPAAARANQCDSLKVEITVKPFCECSPIFPWGFSSQPNIDPTPKPFVLLGGQTKSFTLTGHDRGDGYNTAASVWYKMNFVCSRIGSSKPAHIANTSILFGQYRRHDKKAGFVWGSVVSAPGSASYTAVKGVCSGKHPHPGVIHWGLGGE